MPRKGEKASEETRRRLREAKARMRRRRRVTPKDIRLLRAGEHSAFTHPAIRALLRHGEEEMFGLVEALGGEDELSPQRRVILEDICTMGILARALMVRFGQRSAPDPNIAGRIAALLTSRRQGLMAVGLNRVHREMDLDEYLEKKARGVAEGEPEPVVEIENGLTKGAKRHGKA